MKAFQFNPVGGDICPVCGSNEEKDATLIPIDGTQDGANAEAVQVHVECLTNNLMLYPGPTGSIIAKAAKFYTTEEVDVPAE